MMERSSTVLLKVDDLHVAYGKAEVVHGASFDVRAGEFVVMLGRNGAGKSTMLHAISGLIPKRRGSVTFEGKDLSAATPRQIVQAGIVQVLEGHRVFHTLSVEDNLLIGTYARAPHGDRSRLGPHSLGPASRFVVDHAPCPLLLVWPEPAPGLTTMPGAPPH